MSVIQNAIFLWLLFIFVHIAMPSHTLGKTWFVERDGSGDFIVIQDAVDAAASGDTIKIGLGRFDERHYVTSPGWSDYVRVQVVQSELTIIGSGAGTIIGQDYPWEAEQGLHKGIATGALWGNQILRVENLSLENMYEGIYTSHESKVWSLIDIENCLFIGNNISLWLLSDNGTTRVNNCDFQNSTTSGVFIVGWSQAEIEIRKCDFVRTNNIYSTQAINLSGAQNILIEDCNIYKGTTSVTVSHCNSAIIRNCLFEGQQNVAISLPQNVVMSIENCRFKDQDVVMHSSTTDVQVGMSDSVIEDVTDCSFWISSIQNLSVHNCDLAKGERGVVHMIDNINCLYTAHLDMTNNYWGTSEPDSIQAWIHDRYDTEEACYWVEYEPFESGSTPVENRSLGGFRAMFR